MNATHEVIVGDALTRLKEMEAGSVQCVCTSPPYYGLRDYQTGKWEGGDPACSHTIKTAETQAKQRASSGLTNALLDGSPVSRSEVFRSVCGRCGAARVDSQLGLEDSPAEFVRRLVEVFAEVRRVLRDDGCLFVNIGDSYSGGGGYYPDAPSNQARGKVLNGVGSREYKERQPAHGCKQKDLLGIPWMLAFALRDDGWYLRSEIIWAKKSPMPESVQDRPTKAHEQIFLLTKKPKYFYDAAAERVQALWDAPVTWGRSREADPRDKRENPKGACHVEPAPEGLDRNLWSWWNDLSPSPVADAHFATFPEDLPRRCLRLGTSERGACAKCGSPWRRVVERERKATRPAKQSKVFREDFDGWTDRMRSGEEIGNRDPQRHCTETRTKGWAPSCACQCPDVRPCRVLDPFLGSGTTLVVAKRLGLSGVGIELNEDYAELARRRIAGALSGVPRAKPKGDGDPTPLALFAEGDAP